MNAITEPDLSFGPKAAHDAVSHGRRHHHRSTFSEVRAAQHQRTLAIAATATGIASVTIAASAAVLLGLTA
ncbi:hypothetical protein [Curtobacterium sp. ISL-83]|uniref:hypothetical protein n=1 Tax=Curtobacterium sp. ISL-83 TaxID=2819145 RepID=UPI001BEAD66A|nr:hypothetical protein [Curtobacterium sp. ISL-83]MBT2502207.1 hypothetical protein [Curtobacterium sp. ISL-83]